MVEVVIGVIVGYVLAYLPKAASLFTDRGKAVEKKAREPTEEEKRRAQKAMREYGNFLAYDGTEQEDV